MPFNPGRFHKNWRWNYNFGGGQLLDWIGHHGDIAHWGLSNPKYGCGPDDKVGPLEVSAKAEFPAGSGEQGQWSEACRELSDASAAAWIILSAAVDFETFLRQTDAACAADLVMPLPRCKQKRSGALRLPTS